MEVVYQSQPLSMGWCLDCHRNPEPNLRPVSELTNMSWGLALGLEGEARTKAEAEFAQQRIEVQALYHINPSENCSTCHR
jgi:mono/diheme cytochrome c family protein